MSKRLTPEERADTRKLYDRTPQVQALFGHIAALEAELAAAQSQAFARAAGLVRGRACMTEQAGGASLGLHFAAAELERIAKGHQPLGDIDG
jgi:hypothetical protein